VFTRGEYKEKIKQAIGEHIAEERYFDNEETDNGNN